MPLGKTCKLCQSEFTVTDDDLAFYKKISPTFAGETFEIPPPTLCPECRLQRRLARRNERALYKDKCSLCGKDIVTTFTKGSAIKSYCNSCWYGDGWDPLAYGVDYDEKRSFFEQFSTVYKTTPQICLQNDNEITSQNCEYCQDLAYGKDCYLTSGSWHVENVMYCHEIYRSKDLIDCDYLTDSQSCYDCINSKNLHNCAFVEDSENCHECYFGYGLMGCSNCIECHALKNKSYYYTRLTQNQMLSSEISSSI